VRRYRSLIVVALLVIAAAAGLAGALAALHDVGGSHGNIDLSAVSYSVAHPAKLGAFGRPPQTDPAGDVRALAGVLETAVTGAAPGGPPPSETIDGFPHAIDRILALTLGKP